MSKQFFDQVSLESVEAKGSYGIGLQIGQQLISSQLDIDEVAVAKGIFDALNQNEAALDQQQITAALQELHQRVEENKIII